MDGDGSDEGGEAARIPQPGEDSVEVVADGGKDEVGGVSGAAFEVATPRWPSAIRCPMMGCTRAGLRT